MPVQPTNNLEPAFQLLANTVNEFCLRGRPCLGATLKPKLYTRGFDEKFFQFKKFGDFLRAAEAAGYVKLAKTSGGDIAISPAAVPAAPAQATPPAVVTPLASEPAISAASLLSSSIPLRVRPDLWNAFNSHTDKWVYDPVRDRAFQTDFEVLGLSTRTLIPIPYGPDRLAGWMRAFTETQAPDIKVLLTAQVDRGVDAYRFAAVVRNNGLQRSWQRFHIYQIITAIETWARENGLHPKNIATPFRSPGFTGAPPAPVPTSLPLAAPPSVASSYLNSKLESLVENLINELIVLRGLLAVAGTKQH
jgi:hypothetical protein